MGCFLLITEKDLAQLSKTARAGVSRLGSDGRGNVQIQISSTSFNSAKSMADMIRREVSSSRNALPTKEAQQMAVPTPEKYIHDINYLASKTDLPPLLCKSLVDKTLRSTFGRIFQSSGKEGELVAAQVLEQSQNLTIHNITTSTGPDILASRRSGNSVVVEVKTSISNKPFAHMLDRGSYKSQSEDGQGFTQCSDGWLKAVKVDPGKTDVLGVHINPIKETVTIYRRVDSEAKVWKPIMNAPLSKFDLDTIT